MAKKTMNFPKMLDGFMKYYRNTVLRENNKEYKYDGPDLTSNELLACNPTIKDHLSEESIKWIEEDQGRDIMEELFTCAIQLGIQQGIYMKEKEIEDNKNQINTFIDYIKNVINKK